jgi:phosphoribosylformylglycinamidine (FGAM) synthase-like enzyme
MGNWSPMCLQLIWFWVEVPPCITGNGKSPAYYAESKKFDPDAISQPDYEAVKSHLENHPNCASKKYVFRQYDSMVGTRNASMADPSDSSVVLVKEAADLALCLTVDCNSRYVQADPEIGCQIAVAEAARNIVCSGGKPLAITNCLNFGNPYKPEVYWQFVGAIKGMKTACEAFNTPVTGGNVSFYNQSSDDGPVFPTPHNWNAWYFAWPCPKGFHFL